MTCDVVIVGGGILGLWAAKYACDAGLQVTLVDRGECGSGGSNGVLGALAPHLPDSSNEKKRFHWQALDELPALITALEEQTGLATGYGRTGRLMPVRVEGFQKRMQRCVHGALEHWQSDERQFRFEMMDVAPYEHWINPEFAPLGLVFDEMSARVAPRLLTKALKAAIGTRVTIIEGFSFGHFDDVRGRVVSLDGKRSISTNNLVMAAGYETYELLKPLAGVELGHGVKGHSALFALEGIADLPALYDNGVYVVPHADGTVAVGSSSQNEWSDADEVESAQCTGFIERAIELCPGLRRAELVSKWAGVRPRSFAKDPIVGRLDEDRNIFILTGGFKISFGIAHRLARKDSWSAWWARSERLRLPESYGVAYHLREAEKKMQEITS